MSLYVHRSNRMERLVDTLGGVVSQRRAGPTDPECIVVQGRGMERWLSMRLAERFGIWAVPDFPFPRRFVARVTRALLGEDDPRSASFEPEALLWSIAALLPELRERPGFAPIARYLQEDAGARRRLQLAVRIAATFDQYVVFRPELVLGWERGRGSDWQAHLWRALVGRHGSTHMAARIDVLLHALAERTEPLASLPVRVSVFGVSTLPPLYLQVLVALSRMMEVHLFLLSPSREYWADIRSKREIIRELAERDDPEGEGVEALHLREGNPLLASLGRLGREFQWILEEAADYIDDDGAYEEPGRATMLRTLQSDILNLRRRSAGDAESPAIELADADGSVAVAACHGPMREVEVLHDQLCDLFEKDSTLEPRDVVVMSPAIDAYAPYVDAVFGRVPGAQPGRRVIPYHIADRSRRTTDEVIDAFSRLIEALRGRMTATEVLDLLMIDAVRLRFGIEAEDLDVLRQWVGEAGIRWGADAEHRREAGHLPAVANTWRFGLDRLLLGHAIEGQGRACWSGVLPFDGVEGDAADLLGRFLDFCDELFRFRRELHAPRPPIRWSNDLTRLLERTVAETRLNRRQHQMVRTALAELAERATQGGFDEALPLDTFVSELDLGFRDNVRSSGFLSQGVTFCALVPMRSIPFRVVCLLGMNDGSFPRIRRAPGFDRIAARPRRGDRSQRDDDRYLFLEALLSAREHFLVSYVGQSIRDNSELPPSVVVSDLLDALDESFQLAPATSRKGGSARERIVVRHPLQPFSPRYFGADPHPDERLFSYATIYVSSAEKLVGERRAGRSFVREALPPDPESSALVTIDELVRFFENPSRGFLQRRLGLTIRDEGVIDARDPLELDELAEWAIGQELLRRRMAGEDLAAAFASVAAGGKLPQGTPGRCLYDELSRAAEMVADAARRSVDGERLEPLSIDETFGDVRLTGVIHDLWRSGQARWQYSKRAAKHELGSWIRHLALCLEPRAGISRTTVLVTRSANDESEVIRFGAVGTDEARALLQCLLDFHRLGSTLPLPFFPVASLRFVEVLRKDGDEAKALSEARQKFLGSRASRAERDDPYVALAFGGRDPLRPDFRLFDGAAHEPPSFRDLALAICGPLVDRRAEESA
jgi:exodeoxyribonuclease V gamma subunit